MFRMAGTALLGSGVGAGIGAAGSVAATPLAYLDRVGMNPLATDLTEEEKQGAWDQIASTQAAWGAGVGALLGVAAGVAAGMEPERPPVEADSNGLSRVRQAAIELTQGADGVYRRPRA